MNIRETASGWYIDLPNEECAGPFDEEYDAIMAVSRAYQYIEDKENNDGIRNR